MDDGVSWIIERHQEPLLIMFCAYILYALCIAYFTLSLISCIGASRLYRWSTNYCMSCLWKWTACLEPNDRGYFWAGWSWKMPLGSLSSFKELGRASPLRWPTATAVITDSPIRTWTIGRQKDSVVGTTPWPLEAGPDTLTRQNPDMTNLTSPAAARSDQKRTVAWAHRSDYAVPPWMWCSSILGQETIPWSDPCLAAKVAKGSECL